VNHTSGNADARKKQQRYAVHQRNYNEVVKISATNIVVAGESANNGGVNAEADGATSEYADGAARDGRTGSSSAWW
jgi:hypothetical protein